MPTLNEKHHKLTIPPGVFLSTRSRTYLRHQKELISAGSHGDEKGSEGAKYKVRGREKSLPMAFIDM